MIFIKNSEQIKQMKEAGRITGEAIAIAGEMVREGGHDKAARHEDPQTTLKNAARALRFLGLGGFPGSACISVNSSGDPRYPPPTGWYSRRAIL